MPSSRIAEKPGQHLVCSPPRPTAAKPRNSSHCSDCWIPRLRISTSPPPPQAERKRLARHFIQRRRDDVEKWMGEDTPFPKRDAGEFNYDLSEPYLAFFDNVSISPALSSPGTPTDRQKRVHYWTALGLLRGVMSSPAAGVAMLRAAARNSAATSWTMRTDNDASPVHDHPEGHESDLAPVEVVEAAGWSESQNAGCASSKKNSPPSPVRNRPQTRSRPHDRRGLAPGRLQPRHLLPLHPDRHLRRRTTRAASRKKFPRPPSKWSPPRTRTMSAATALTPWAITRSASSSPLTASRKASTSTSTSPPSSTTICRGIPTAWNSAKAAWTASASPPRM